MPCSTSKELRSGYMEKLGLSPQEGPALIVAGTSLPTRRDCPRKTEKMQGRRAGDMARDGETEEFQPSTSCMAMEEISSLQVAERVRPNGPRKSSTRPLSSPQNHVFGERLFFETLCIFSQPCLYSAHVRRHAEAEQARRPFRSSASFLSLRRLPIA